MGVPTVRKEILDAVGATSLLPLSIHVEVGVEQGVANDGSGVVDLVGAGEAAWRHPVVLEVRVGPFQQGGRIAIDIAEHEFVDDHVVGIGNDVMVGLPRHVLLPEDVSRFRTPRAGMEQGLFVFPVDGDFDPCAAGRIAGGKLVAGLVGEEHVHAGQAVIEDEGGLEVERLLFEHLERAGDGAVELDFGGAQSEGVDVVAQHAKHVRVGPDEVME